MFYPINEDLNRSKALLKELKIPENDEDFLKIKNILKNNTGYIYWFTKLVYVDNIPLAEIEQLWDIIKNNRNILQQFKKNIVDMDTIEEFYDAYDEASINMSIKRAYNGFASSQKNMLDLNDPTTKTLLNALDLDKNKQDFYKKASSYKSTTSLLEALKRFIYNKTGSSYNDILRKVEKSSAKIVEADPNNEIIICEVNYNQICELGGDTAWCIVRSEYTFNSYTSSPLSKQYIIFLTDKSDNYSKIGVTININGYYTAHLKDDTHLALDSLMMILKDRDYPISNLLPDKENLSINDINNASVLNLLSFGFTKEEILSTKKLYNSSDMNEFTKEEINDNSLLDKISINSLSEVKNLGVDEIIKKKIYNRVKYLTLGQFLDVGFSKQQILDNDILNLPNLPIDFLTITKYDINYDDKGIPYDKIYELYHYDSNDNVIYGYDKIKNIDSVFSSKDGYKKIFKAFTFSHNMTSILLGTFSYFKLDPLDLIDFSIKSLDMFKFFELKGIEITKEILAKLLAKGNRHLELKSYIYLYKIDKLKDYVFDHILKLSLTIDSIRNDLKNVLSPKHYNELLDYKRRELIDNYYKLPSSDGELYKYVDFYQLNKYVPISHFSFQLRRERVKGLKNFLDKFYPNNDLLRTYLDINDVKLNELPIKTLSDLIDDGVDSEAVKGELYNKLINSTKSHYIPTKVNDIFSEEEKENIKNVSTTNEALENIGKYSRYWTFPPPSSPRRGGTIDYNTEFKYWYSTYGDISLKIDYTNLKINDSYIYNIGIILLLLKSDNVDKLKDLKVDLLIKIKSYDNKTVLDKLCALICGLEITNSRPTWNLELSDDDKKILYDFIISWLKDNNKLSNYSVLRSLQVVNYIYDRDMFNKFYDEAIVKTKNYDFYIASTQKYSKRTNRIFEFTNLISYFLFYEKYDEFKQFLEKFHKDVKMSKLETKLTIKTIRDAKYYGSGKTVVINKILEIVNNIFNDEEPSKDINESFRVYIKSFNNFK